MSESNSPHPPEKAEEGKDSGEDCGWEAVVLRRIRGRVQEVSRHLGDLVHGDACGWESRSVELLKEKLGIGTSDFHAEPIRSDKRLEHWRGHK